MVTLWQNFGTFKKKLHLVDVFELGVELVEELKEEVERGIKHEEMVDDH